MSAICVGSCRWISLAAATADPVVAAMRYSGRGYIDQRENAEKQLSPMNIHSLHDAAIRRHK